MTHLSHTNFAFALAPLAVARGSWYIVAVCALMFFGLVIGWFTERGSGITPRPYGKVYGGAPGAIGPGSLSGHDDREHVSWSRGTR